MSSVRIASTAYRVAAVLAVLLTAAVAETMTWWSGGWARLDVVLLATVLRESRSRLVQASAVSTVLATAWVVEGVTWRTSVAVAVAVAVAAGVGWALRAHGSRTDLDSLPGRRFMVVIVRLTLVVVLGAAAEVALESAAGTVDTAPMLLRLAYAALPLAVAGLLAAAIAARSVLDRRAEPHVAKLAGAFVALALSGIAAQISLEYWNSQDATTLQTAAATTTASFQQAVADDLDSFDARAGSVPRTPVTSQSAFDRSVRSFL